MPTTDFQKGTTITKEWLNEADDHIFDQTGSKHSAAHITNTPAGNLASTDVQSAINELDTEKAKAGVNSDITELDQPSLTTPPGNTDVSSKIVTSQWVRTQGVPTGYLKNVSFKVTVAANACTVTLTNVGNISDSDGYYLGAVRSWSDTSGLAVPILFGTSPPYSITIPNGATLGTLSGTPARIWVVLYNYNSGADWDLALVNCVSGGNILSLLGASGASALTEKCNTTAISAAAGSAGVFYGNSAKTGSPFVVLGCFDITEATAGVWATAPTAIHLNPTFRPGQVIQSYRNYSGAVETSSTQFVDDDNVPSVTAGAVVSGFNGNVPAGLSCAAPNKKRITAQLNVAVTVGADSIMASIVDTTANSTLACARYYDPTASQIHQLRVVAECPANNSVSIRYGPIGAHTVTLNGMAGTRKHGGALQSSALVEIISA